MATQVGVICGATTGRVYAVINPDEDSELDSPRWLLIQLMTELREPVTLVKVSMIEYMACKHPDEVAALAGRAFVKGE